MTEPAIDLSTFTELQDAAGAEFVAELVGTFLDTAPAMLAELRSAQEAGASDTFRRTAHSIKSNSSTFGATRLGALARDLELGGLNAERAPLDALEAEYRRVAVALRGLRSG